MGRPAILLSGTLSLLLASAPIMAADGRAGAETPAPTELRFTKGDTRDGAQVRIRITGDSVHYSRTIFETGKDAVESRISAPLDSRRKSALGRIMGDLPRYRVFGSCFGKGMRYYLIDTPAGRFYRSVPEGPAGCYADEPGIWTFFEDLDAFIAPPQDPADPDISTAFLSDNSNG